MFKSISKTFLYFTALFFLIASVAHAAMDFNSYAITKNTISHTLNGVTSESTQVSYELTRLGSTSLAASNITITSHGSYLSILEEATLTGNIDNRPHDITKDFLFQGSLPIPPLAALHSLAAIHGDTLFPAKLHKMTYSLDDSFFDTLALQSTLNDRVAFLQQLSDHSFEATFTKLSLGEPLRIRIEYDLPFPGAPGTFIHVPVLFDPSGDTPRQIQITFFEEAQNYPALQYLSDNGRVTLNTAGTHTFDYKKAFEFKRDENPKTIATFQRSTFESGKLKGNYLLFKTGLNDSLMNLLTTPLEVTFLWRWNPPYNFVEFQNGLNTLSPLGQMAVTEARTLKQIILEMTPRGHRFGLFHSIPDQDPHFFPPAEINSDGYKKLLDYLDQFTETQIFNNYKDVKNNNLAWSASPWSDSTAILKSQSDFVNTLSKINAAFSHRSGILKHIEMIGLGSTPTTLIDLNDPKKIESLMDSTTLSNILATWPGIDLTQILNYKLNHNLRPLTINSPLAAGLSPLLFPVFQPTSIEYRAFTSSHSHAVVLPFKINAERECIIKSENAFEDTLELQGINELGQKTRILNIDPRISSSFTDSSLARLWAADPDRISEITEVDIGSRYGILTKGTYWSAGIHDGTKYVAKSTQPNTIGILPKNFQMRSGIAYSLNKNYLRIFKSTQSPNESSSFNRIEIYNLRGQLILSLNLNQFINGDAFDIPLQLLKNANQGTLLIVLSSPQKMQAFKITMGGVL